MSPSDLLIEVLNRIAQTRNSTAVFTTQELNQYPEAALSALTSQKLLIPATPAVDTQCPGCEEQCTRPVHKRTHPVTGQPSVFVVCDLRTDTHYVPIDSDQLTQWVCNANSVCTFIAKCLAIRFSHKKANTSKLWEIGYLSKGQKGQILKLKAENELHLIAGDRQIPLADTIDYEDAAFFLDPNSIYPLINSKPITKHDINNLKTQERHKTWQKEYKKLKRKLPNLPDTEIARRIAKMPIAQGKMAGTIRRIMTK
jgi:hypothetical protein